MVAYNRNKALMEVLALSKVSGIPSDELMKYKLPKYYDTYKVNMDYLDKTQAKEEQNNDGKL